MHRTPAPVFGVSTWSLHRTLGVAWPDSPAGRGERSEAWGPGTLDILDLPAAVASRGIRRIHLCHFHVADRGADWVATFRETMAEAGVTLGMLLIDDGDLTDPANHERDRAWIGGWIDTAAALGAETARVVAGKAKPSPDTIALAASGLRTLVRRGRDAGVKVATENWFDLLGGPDEVDAILDRVDGLGFLADFGNWKGEDKYDGLARILRRADDTHAKANFPAPGVIDAVVFRRCLDACAETGYDGPYTLIYEASSGDEWGALAVEEEFTRDHLARLPVRRTA